MALNKWNYTSFESVDEEDDQRIMMLFKYEQQKYDDPKKDPKPSPPTPEAPGKITTAIELMENEEL